MGAFFRFEHELWKILMFEESAFCCYTNLSTTIIIFKLLSNKKITSSPRTKKKKKKKEGKKIYIYMGVFFCALRPSDTILFA